MGDLSKDPVKFLSQYGDECVAAYNLWRFEIGDAFSKAVKDLGRFNCRGDYVVEGEKK